MGVGHQPERGSRHKFRNKDRNISRPFQIEKSADVAMPETSQFRLVINNVFQFLVGKNGLNENNFTGAFINGFEYKIQGDNGTHQLIKSQLFSRF